VITVTEDARDLFREVDNPDGTVLRLDPVTAEGVTAETQVRLGIGEPKNNDQVVQHEGEDLLCIARPPARPSTGAPSTWWRHSKDRTWLSSRPATDYHCRTGSEKPQSRDALEDENPKPSRRASHA
jgi:iron-sulfur cluster assembly protein